MGERYLTKSRFKLGLECPTKLYYTGKKEYVNNKFDDEFNQTLVEGGFQVGELAKLYHPDGYDIKELGYNESLEKTNHLLLQNEVTIYEAAIQSGELFIRVDVLIKDGNKVDIVEVKAKSYNSDDGFLTSTKAIRSNWKPYLYDIAFQTYVIENAFQDFEVTPYLMLADKKSKTSVEGLNQKFLIKNENGRSEVEVIGNTDKAALGDEILIKVNVRGIVDTIFNETNFNLERKLSFEELINLYSENYSKDVLLDDGLGVKCKSCEFIANQDQINSGLKSGYHECWKRVASFKDDDFLKARIEEVSNFRKVDQFIKEGKYFQEEVKEEDINLKKSDGSGLTSSERQLLQIEKAVNQDDDIYLDKKGVVEEMSKWNFPLHFIDFETTAVAIPFNSNRAPYEQILFQYSHHVVDQKGNIEHKGEWINTNQGIFPNFDFVRALKSELETDEGTIFRYSSHENTMLNVAYRQLRESEEKDKDGLCEWIKTITISSNSSDEKWEGERSMVDLLEVIKKYFYQRSMKGSNSIKDVLPAILNTSDYLKQKYSAPIYGDKIPSKNFENHIWITTNERGVIINPYKTLPPVLSDLEGLDENSFLIDTESGIQEGGAAMAAYAKMQFSQMSDTERESITQALLRYCELDTFAMVLIWEALQDWVK